MNVSAFVVETRKALYCMSTVSLPFNIGLVNVVLSCNVHGSGTHQHVGRLYCKSVCNVLLVVVIMLSQVWMCALIQLALTTLSGTRLFCPNTPLNLCDEESVCSQSIILSFM